MITPAAYDTGIAAWLGGPEPVFDVLAEVLVGALEWSGLVLDLGCGTGTAGRRIPATVLSVDASVSMLAVARPHSSGGAVVGDVLALPLADAVADGAVLGFVLNHLTDPAAGLREVRRVLRRGGQVAATTWAADDPRHVQDAVEAVVRRHGWSPPDWYTHFKRAASARSDTPALLAGAAASAGLRDVSVTSVDIRLPLPADALVGWRLGLPHTAPWLDTVDRRAVEEESIAAVAALPAPSTRILVLTAAC